MKASTAKKEITTNSTLIYSEPETLSRTWVIFVLIACMLFAIALSYFFLIGQSLRLDEAQSLWQTGRVPSEVLGIVAQDVHVPLYHLILHFWRVFVADGVSGSRVLSLIFFVASIPALYLLGRQVYGRSVSLFAAVLLAVSPFINWYGNEIRMYTMIVFFTILNFYFFLRLMKRPTTWMWVGYAITAIIGIYTHYYFGFALLTEAIFFAGNTDIFPKRSFWKLALVAALVVLSLSPWLYYVRKLNETANTTPLLTKPGSINLFNTFSQFLFGFQDDHINTIIVSFWPIVALLGFIALKRNKRVSPETLFFILSTVLPITFAFALSIIIQPIYLTRYLILTLPAFYLVISWLLSTYPRSLSIALRTFLIGGMLAMFAVQTVNAMTPVKEDYRSAAYFLNANSRPQDAIIVSAPFTIYPIEYYYQGSSNIWTIPIWNRYINGPIPNFSEKDLPAQVSAINGSHEVAWLVLSYDQGYEDNIRNYFDTHYQRIAAKNFSPDLNIYAYRLRYDTPFMGR